MKRYSRTVRIKGKTERLPITDLPENWRIVAEGHIKRILGKPLGSIEGKAWVLRKFPPGFGALVSIVDKSLVKLWMHAAPLRLQESLRGLEIKECSDAAQWFISAADVAKSGLIAKPDQSEDRVGRAIKFFAYEIMVIAEIASADEFWRKIHLTADDADLRANAVRLLQKDGNRFFNHEQFEAALEFYCSPIHHRPKGRPGRRTKEAIFQLTEMNQKIFGHEVFESTAALMKAFFPERAWSTATVRSAYPSEQERRKAARRKAARLKVVNRSAPESD
jgi:hypothetical protein